MSDFVNYHKRSVALPPGCKDLTDLFGLAAPAPPLADAPPAPFTLLPKVKKKKKSLSEMKQAAAAFHFPSQPLPLPFEMAWHESGSVTLDQIEPLLARVSASQMRVSSLTLHASGDETVHWSLMRIREPVEASHCVLKIPYASAEQVAAADRIFAAQGMELGRRKSFRRLQNFHLCKPEAPSDILYTIESMPPETDCAKLVQALFQELVPGGTGTPLKFTYRELRRKADDGEAKQPS